VLLGGGRGALDHAVTVVRNALTLTSASAAAEVPSTVVDGLCPGVCNAGGGAAAMVPPLTMPSPATVSVSSHDGDGCGTSGRSTSEVAMTVRVVEPADSCAASDVSGGSGTSGTDCASDKEAVLVPCSSPHSGDHRAGSDGLRAAGVGPVVAASALGDAVLPGGWVGADVLLVVAGYLLSRSLAREVAATGRVDLVRYLARRVWRAIPAAAAALVAITVAARLVQYRSEWAAQRADVLAAAVGVINWRFVSTPPDAGLAQPSWVLHYWLLAVVGQVAAAWVVVAAMVATCAPQGVGWRNHLHALLLAAVVAAGASFLLAAALAAFRPAAALFSTFSRAWEMAAGGVLALVEAHAARGVPVGGAAALAAVRRHGRVAALVAAVTLLACAVFYSADAIFHLHPARALPPVVATVVLLATGSTLPPSVTRALASGPVAYVASLSYTVYLLHWPAIQVARRVAAALADRQTRGGGGSEATSEAHYIAAGLGTVMLVAMVAAAVRDCTRSGPRRGVPAPPMSSTRALLAGVVAIAAASAAPAVLLAGAAGDDVPRRTRRPGATEYCIAPLEYTAPTAVCGTFGNPQGPRHLALLGDSHAAMWAPGFAALTVRNDWDLVAWSKEACPLLVFPDGATRWNVDAQRWVPYRACDAYNAALLAKLRSRGRLDAVFLARDYDVPRATILAKHGAAGLLAALNATMDALATVTDDVMLIRDPPRPRPASLLCAQDYPDTPAAEAAAGALLGADRPCDDRRRTGVDVVDTAVWDIEWQLPAYRRGALPRIHFLDPASLLCDAAKCHTLSDVGSPNMRDARHIAGSFTVYHAGWLEGAARYMFGVADAAAATASSVATVPK